MEDSLELIRFNKLFSKYQERFIRFACTYTRDNSVAEDIVMESFLYYWENKNKIEKELNIPAYILTIVKHKCLNYLQHIQVKENTSSLMREHLEWELNTRIATLKVFDPEVLFTDEIREIVNKSLMKLPNQTRRVFIMSRYDNKSYEFIAKELGITQKGVEYHINKALKLLRVSLKDYLLICFYFICDFNKLF